MAGLAIFVVAMLIVGPIWGSLNAQVNSIEENRGVQRMALAASEALVRTRGFPENWNTSNVQGIGLAGTEERVLDATKSKYFFELLASNYTETKFKLGVGWYELNVDITDKNNTVILFEGVAFSRGAVPLNATLAANTQRIVIMEFNQTSREFVNVKVVVWR